MMRDKAVKLHLGCGTKHWEGWVNIDAVKSCQPDLVHDLRNPLPYEDCTADIIVAEDLLEHFDKYMRYILLEDWARVLKIGGIIRLQVPNFKKILHRYFKFGFNNFVDFIFGENMWGSEVYNGHFGNHKFGYSAKTLQQFIWLFGIKTISIKNKGLNLYLEGKKIRHVSREEIDSIEVYSFANDHGKGKAYLPLHFIRKKIEEYRRDQGRD